MRSAVSATLKSVLKPQEEPDAPEAPPDESDSPGKDEHAPDEDVKEWVEYAEIESDDDEAASRKWAQETYGHGAGEFSTRNPTPGMTACFAMGSTPFKSPTIWHRMEDVAAINRVFLTVPFKESVQNHYDSEKKDRSTTKQMKEKRIERAKARDSGGRAQGRSYIVFRDEHGRDVEVRKEDILTDEKDWPASCLEKNALLVGGAKYIGKRFTSSACDAAQELVISLIEEAKTRAQHDPRYICPKGQCPHMWYLRLRSWARWCVYVSYPKGPKRMRGAWWACGMAQVTYECNTKHAYGIPPVHDVAPGPGLPPTPTGGGRRVATEPDVPVGAGRGGVVSMLNYAQPSHDTAAVILGGD
jgi:hypothetical protein